MAHRDQSFVPSASSDNFRFEFVFILNVSLNCFSPRFLVPPLYFLLQLSFFLFFPPFFPFCLSLESTPALLILDLFLPPQSSLPLALFLYSSSLLQSFVCRLILLFLLLLTLLLVRLVSFLLPPRSSSFPARPATIARSACPIRPPSSTAARPARFASPASRRRRRARSAGFARRPA